MRTKIDFCRELFVCFMLLAGGKLSAQCNSVFSYYTNTNTPATIYVTQPGNNATDSLYIWNWGDGSLNDTTYYANPNYPTITHDYASAGVYTVCVNFVSISMGCNVSSCQNFTVTTLTMPPKTITIISAIDSTYTGPCPQLPVTGYFDLGSNVLGFTPSDSVEMKISFGDGADTVFKASPHYYSTGTGYAWVNDLLHTYTLPGLYSVQYIISSIPPGVGDTLTAYNQIDLQDSCGNLNGYVYADINGNCLLDGGDSLLSNQWIEILTSTNNTFWTVTDSNGYYSIQVPITNTYTLSNQYVSNYGYTYVCGGAGLSGVTAPANVNVGLSCPAGFDLSGFMWGWRFVPGQIAEVHVWPHNFSCMPQSGTVILTLDPNTTFVSEKNGKPVNVTGNIADWSFSNLNAITVWWGQTPQMRDLNLSCSPNLQIGDSVCYDFSVSPLAGDVNQANNTFSKCFEVRSSYDPNFKEVYPRGVGAQGFVAQNTEFTYTIHFQNTGNAQAYNIAILDTIDTDLDMSTFQIIAASHYVEPHMVGNNGIKFQFNNIMLPDSASDPEGSQGWVTYKIKAKPGQPGGTQYTNTAYIYFDFNPAIITNTTINTIELSAVGIAQQNVEAGHLSVAPNPVSDFTQLTLSSKEQGIVTIKVIDMLGQIVSSDEKALNKGKNVFNVNTRDLSQGIYLLNAEVNGKMTGSVKILK